MNKKAFTLIELLSVLVILAIIISIAVPSLIKAVIKNQNDGGEAIEEVLEYNLRLYNEDKKEDLWKDDKTCIVVPIIDLVSFNPSIDMGECKLTDNDSLVIKRIIGDKYTYYANITCGKHLSKNTYVLEDYNEKDIYYRTNIQERCN